MMSPELELAVKQVSDLEHGYVFHPIVIRLAIDEAMRPVLVPVNLTSRVKQSLVCRVSGCDRETHANSLCHPHYKRHLRGTLTDAPLRVAPKYAKVDRIEKKQRVKAAIIGTMGSRCMRCQSSYPSDVYDFHHVFGKEMEITRVLGRVSPENIALEVSKCVLLCANCHRLEHLWLRLGE